MRKLLPSIPTILVVIPAALLSDALRADECRYESERAAVVEAVDAGRLEIIARAGHLTVRGAQGRSEVRVSARACASSEDVLDEIRLVAERRGDTVHVEALMPERGWFDWGDDRAHALLDMVVDVPAGITADIDDSSGGIELSRLGTLTLDDSSGSIFVDDIAGSVTIDDSSGEIRVENVTGSVDIDDSSGGIIVHRSGPVRIDDSSGSIEVRDAEGSVDLADSSGLIDVSRVAGDVTVRRDSSGGILARDVDGHFVVERDSSGGIDYRNIGGSVRVPSR